MATYRRANPGGESTHQWKSEGQRLKVLKGLKDKGVEVEPFTPPETCWKLLAEALIKEMRGEE